MTSVATDEDELERGLFVARDASSSGNTFVPNNPSDGNESPSSCRGGAGTPAKASASKSQLEKLSRNPKMSLVSVALKSSALDGTMGGGSENSAGSYENWKSAVNGIAVGGSRGLRVEWGRRRVLVHRVL